MDVRAPAVAGLFYPADPRELESAVAALLQEAGHGAPSALPAKAPKALIVPHAGYVYSGPVAASAYAQLAPLRDRIRRVVLLGPAHRVALAGLAAPECEALLTPLGAVSVDREALTQLADLPCFALSDRAHREEHSLEVQLPFLQASLGAFRVVPLVVGDASDAEVAEVLERLWGGEETLIVISSDLSHYHDYATARRMDASTCAAIEALQPEALDWESACGRVPVRGLLRAAARHGLAARTLDLRSSGDTAGDRARVVGYGAWSLAVRDLEETLESEDESRLLDIARASIDHGLSHGQALEPDLVGLPASLRQPGACFVTLRGADGSLRGCIGSLEANRPLATDVASNAFAAASRDPRMPPVQRGETLALSISLLSPLEPIRAASLDDVVGALRPGRDGLLLEDGKRSGTLLPQVWQQIDDARHFVGCVWQKAGLPPDHWAPGCRAYRYRVHEIAAPDR